ncbi:MAG: prepilin-type N-terminal cleavage/methylation domain-containing protein [Thermoanaerobaculia bacterium]|nr:prepilin-type N-terminal cleavage/methylation domain-containing protein [Thermoanaerobaculia bacterium]
MLHRRVHRGFTLIELLVVVAIIGIIAAIIIPMFLDALQKSKQKRTMAEVRLVGTCWMAWLTDQVAAGAAGTSVRTYELTGLDEIEPEQLLSSLYVSQNFFYCTEVPVRDSWGHDYEYYVNPETLLGIRVMAIRSTGRDGVFSDTTYEIGPYVATDYDEDILWADGLFVHYPAGRAMASNAL